MRHISRDYCLEKAEECQREADRARDEGTRRLFDFYVRHWHKLADTYLEASPPSHAMVADRGAHGWKRR